MSTVFFSGTATDSVQFDVFEGLSESEVRSIIERVATRVPADGTWSCAAVAENGLKFLKTTFRPTRTFTES